MLKLIFLMKKLINMNYLINYNEIIKIIFVNNGIEIYFATH